MNPAIRQARDDAMKQICDKLAEECGGATDSPHYSLAAAEIGQTLTLAAALLEMALARGLILPGPCLPDSENAG